ncbi:phage tail protein [Kosakonia sacchari]|uniref:phage tail protein n=1 Tax=Kosakonia sacchari TaxID=1158459 RepID=UPI0009F6E425|nr:phage tail protein [Kosakonia sacchari]
MTAKFFAILTNQGAALLANATALGTKLNITQMAVGDGNGTLPTPDATQTKLVNQRRIAPLNMLSVDANNSSQIIAEQVIPENEGGFWIREIGLYDDNGVLIAVANCPETYKPQLQEGSGRTQTIRMVLIVSSTAAVTLKIDPSVVLATRQYVDNAVIEVKAYADNLLKQHIADTNPHKQYAPVASPVFTGTPKAPTAAQTSNDTQLATTAFVQAAINALISGELSTKQPLDKTLTDLSGKSVAAILEYLGLTDTSKLAGRLLASPTVITTSGQFILPATGNLFRIRVQGAGGGSGAARATSSTTLSASGGGASGSYVELWLTRSELEGLTAAAGGHLDIVIGAGGTGGVASAGGDGGTTSFGNLIVCPGGKGSDYGIITTSTTTGLANGGASSAEPTITVPGLSPDRIILKMAGAPGHFGISVQSPTLAGNGANSPLGNGGVGSGASATQSGGKGFGSGAGGVSNGNSSATKNGAEGANGVIIFEVYA